MQRDEMKLLAVRATLWRMEIEILREIHRYRFAKRGRRFGSDVELMIVYGAAMVHYGFGRPVRAAAGWQRSQRRPGRKQPQIQSG
jgi:hypothetical protein